MRKSDMNCGVAVLAAVLVVALVSGPVLAQEVAPATGPAGKEKLADLWNNFLHYIQINRADLAQSYGQAIINAKPDPRNLYYLSAESDKSGTILTRGRALKDLAPTVDQITALIDAGTKAVRMDPAEIARWIEMLSGTTRQFLMATERLVNSGEYAVPQMINKLSDVKTTPLLRERIITALPRLGAAGGVASRVSVVRALVEALATKDPAVKEVICRTLGKIGYPQAAPYLKELIDSTEGGLNRTRDAARGALSYCAGRVALKKPAAELFYDMAVKYYDRRESYNPDSRYETANVWYWQEGLGVSYKVVPRAIFNDIYAMRAARKALEYDADFDPAVTIWVAANLRKEANLPEGEKDPTRSADEPGAKFVALAGGAKYLQRVLARSLADDDTAVALAAIEALGRTTGAKNLVTTVVGGAQPLVEALSCPSRKVRYLAAEALALARPQKRFPGWHLVVPVLTEALRATGTPTAVLADPDLGHRNKVKDLLRGSGYNVIDDAAFGKALQDARDAGGADLVVLASNVTGPNMAKAAISLRREAVLSRIPVIIVAKPADVATARVLAKNDPLITVLPDEALDAAAMAAAVKQASGAAALSDAEAAEWSVRAAKCLRLLAMTSNPVYDRTEATKSLIAALADNREPVRLAAAEALAQFRAAEAQRAIAGLALDAEADETVRVAAYGTLSESVRRFGNQLTEEQIEAIIDEVMSKGSLKIRDAAAQVMGALALPSEKVKELIQAHPL